MYPITINGISVKEYKIVCGESKQENYAANELKSYFEKIAGEIPCGNGEKTINIKIDLESGLCSDGFTVKNTENELSIIGGGGSGVIYGVYDILEKYLGVRFISAEIEKLGDGGDIPLVEYTDEPLIYAYRSCDLVGTSNEWKIKNRVAAYGPQFIETSTKKQKFRSIGGCHTMASIFGVSQDKEQPCLSDPKNFEIAMDYIRREMKNNPSANVIDISQNDNFNYCTCERCAAIDEEEGNHMGSLMRFINAVAEQTEKEFPGVMIQTFAYTYSRTPCKTPPRDNVTIKFCTIEGCFSHPLDSSCEENQQIRSDLIAWGKQCKCITIWDYVINFRNYLATFPDFFTLRENMRFFAENHVVGIYPEGNYQSISGEFGELRAYLLAKLMWNPMMSEKEYFAHMDEFLEGYYGDGWRYIRAYIDFTCAEMKRGHLRCYMDPLDILSADMICTMYDTIENWWNAAEAMAGDKIENVKRSRLQWTYLSLWGKYDKDRAEKLYDETVEKKIRWRECALHPIRPNFDNHIKTWWNKYE